MSEKITETYEKVRGEAGTADCDNCGGDVVFDPKTQSLVCQFCGHQQGVEGTSDFVGEIDFDRLAEFEMDSDWQRVTKVMACNNCGGEIVTAPEDETAFCVFCGSQHMVAHEGESAGMKPQGIVPYVITYDEARERMNRWVKRRFMAPRDLKKRFRGEHLKGIYMPYWTFDANVYARYSVDIGEYYYTGTGDKRKRHTRWHSYDGQRRKFFDDRLVLGVEAKESGLIKEVEPFNTGKGHIKDYNPEYLAGYLAKKHIIDPKPAWRLAKESMATDLAREIKSSLHGDTYRNYSQQVTYYSKTFKHILLPVYMSAYAYGDKVYNVVINGQTGEVQGKSPVSWVKVSLILLVVAVILALIFLPGEATVTAISSMP